MHSLLQYKGAVFFE